MKIKLTVKTGYLDCDHVEYLDLPSSWSLWDENQKLIFLEECASEYMRECCESYGEVVEDEEDE